MLTAFKEGTIDFIFASKGIVAICPECGEKLITKCGRINTPHFAHSGNNNCGYSYHDSMSEWHYNWQLRINNPSPGINIEVPVKGEYSKRADVITKEDVIIEFQKSPLPVGERILREQHYKNMIWVVHKDIENSKTWDTHKSKTVILIDNPKKNYLYLYSDNRIKIGKSPFIKVVINGDVAHPDIFFNIVRARQINRSNNRLRNLLSNYTLAYEKHPQKYYVFKFLNNEIEKMTSTASLTLFEDFN